MRIEEEEEEEQQHKKKDDDKSIVFKRWASSSLAHPQPAQCIYTHTHTLILGGKRGTRIEQLPLVFTRITEVPLHALMANGPTHDHA